MSEQASLFRLKLYRVEGHLSTYLVNAYNADDAIGMAYMNELEKTYGNVDYFGYHAKQVDTTKERIVCKEID